jgi:hypothetical protein
MQVSSSPSLPVAAAAPPGAFTSRVVLPHELQVARIGKGSVASEIDRSIRVLLKGDGPASTREVVPDSKAAAELLASEHGPKFEQAIHSFVSVADGFQGKENLKSITFLPDEHASKGVSILNRVDQLSRAGLDIDAMLQPTEYRVGLVRKQLPQYSRDEIRATLRQYAAAEAAKQLTDGEAAQVAFAGAWNGDGHIVVMPDVSRDMLATLGLYRLQPGDQTTTLPRDERDDAARWSWHAAIHESHHSITPLTQRGPEWTSVMEESVPEVLTPSSIDPTIRAAGADPKLAARPARDTKHEAVDWSAWSRAHLPAPDADSAATAQGRYTDGPELVRDLQRMAGIDRRTTDGKATATELLQGQQASRVPGRIADAIASAHGLDDKQADKLANLIRQAAIGNGSITTIQHFLDGTDAAHADHPAT